MLGNKLLKVAWVGVNDYLLFQQLLLTCQKLFIEFQVTNTREHEQCGYWPPYAAVLNVTVQFTCHFCSCSLCFSLRVMMAHVAKETHSKVLDAFFKFFPLASNLRFAAEGQAVQVHTFHLMLVFSGRSNILDELDWGNTDIEVRKELKTSSLGLLIIIFFTLLALTHGQSSVSKTTLLWSVPADSLRRSHAWQPNKEQEEWSTNFFRVGS